MGEIGDPTTPSTISIIVSKGTFRLVYYQSGIRNTDGLLAHRRATSTQTGY